MTNHEDKIDFAGKNGFVWWVGVVEDRKDPIKLGRVRVRCVGWHAEDKMKLPTEMLPWAMPSYPPNHTHTYAPKEGDMAFGFFADGESAQNPVIVGIFPSIPLKAANRQEAFSDPRTDEELKVAPRPPKSKTYNKNGSGIKIEEYVKKDLYPNTNYYDHHLDEPTTHRIARNETEYIQKTFIQERKDNVVQNVPVYNFRWTEPTTKYDAKYPYNNVIQTESGHLLEFDDTFGKERVHLAHRNGSFQEMFPDGDKVEKVTKDNYEIVMGSDHILIMGSCYVTVQGNAEVYVQGNAGLKVDGNFDARVGGTTTWISGGNYRVRAPRIDLN